MGGGELEPEAHLPLPPWAGKVGRIVDPLPSSVQAARIQLKNKQSLSAVYEQQCKNCAETIAGLRESRDKVMRQMQDYADSATYPGLRETYLNAVQTAHNSFIPSLEIQAKTLADMEEKYMKSLQEVADYEVTIAFMEDAEREQRLIKEQEAIQRNFAEEQRVTPGNENESNNNNNNNNISSTESPITSGDKPIPDITLQQLMPYWAVVNERDAEPYHFARYHRCGQGFNFEGWDDEERAKITSVIHETHREAENEIERHCERHTDWDEQYPKLFIDFPAFLANTSGCGVAFGRGRVNFVDKIKQQIESDEFKKCLRALGTPEFNTIKAIVITAKKGPLKGNKSVEVQFYDRELIVLWNDLDNISSNGVSFDDFVFCKN